MPRDKDIDDFDDDEEEEDEEVEEVEEDEDEEEEEEEESEGEKRRARMSVGGFVNDWIDETFHLEYDAKRWSRVERGLVIGSIAVVGVCVVVFLRNREFIEKAKLLWGVCFQSIVSFVLVGMEMKGEKRESVVKEE